MTSSKEKPTIQVTVRPFAMLRELMELEEVEALELELPADSPAEALLDALLERAPVLGPYGRHLLMARDGEYLEAMVPLTDGDVVSLYPPLSGG